MASSSIGKQSAVSKYVEYPDPLASYEDVRDNPKLFMETLKKLLASMNTRFFTPIIGGKKVDLHRLFVEVTARGGHKQAVRENRWNEVTAVFKFPKLATNVGSVLHRHYRYLLHHYEQIYFFKARGFSTPRSSVPLKTPSVSAMSGKYQVAGVIDGKYESGFIVTVTFGSENLRGFLYQPPQEAETETSAELGERKRIQTRRK